MTNDSAEPRDEPRASLKIAGELNQLAEVRRFVEAQTGGLGIGQAAAYDIMLAVEELVTNIIVHGYQRRPEPIEIELWPSGSALVIRLLDRAPPFDPTQAPRPNTTLPLELRAPGGMGILLARHFMTEVSHRNRSGGGNELTLVKADVLPASHEE